MRIIIDKDVLTKDEYFTNTPALFGVLVYYILGGTGVLNEELCEELWNNGYLNKTLDGYEYNSNKNEYINHLMSLSSISNKSQNRYIELAEKLRELYPNGKKEGTIYYWRDSAKVIASRLINFFKKYGDYSDEEVIQATQKYINSFNGNYTLMQLLKYFISKKDKQGEDTSMLASYLENLGEEDINTNTGDWMSELK